tara:strand:- start:2 stop:505 length:504 start_codon:yes stop_codon:yes gene_type:complete
MKGLSVSKKGLITLILVVILSWFGLNVSQSDVSKYVDMAISEQTAKPISPEPSIRPDFNEAGHISSQRRTHILYGDATGGGHLYGVGKPCKSEFPKYWDEQTVIKKIELIAANDNLNWEQQRNGYYVTEQKVGTINVRVVKGRDGEQVITAYPTNVPRNPCPANDNY